MCYARHRVRLQLARRGGGSISTERRRRCGLLTVSMKLRSYSDATAVRPLARACIDCLLEHNGLASESTWSCSQGSSQKWASGGSTTDAHFIQTI